MNTNKYFRVWLPLACLFIMVNKSYAQSVLDNTQLRFFADAGLSVSRDSSDTLKPAFQFGGIEMLITSQVTDKISLLAEPVLKSDGSVSMERVMLNYSFNNYFNISAGRLYTPIGIWNTTFYRYAKALNPTIDAPQVIANFEEGGSGINKDIGVQISGNDITNARLGYRLMVGNGYNAFNSSKKIIYYNVFAEPLDNLKISVSGVHQHVNAGLLPANVTLNSITLAAMYIGGKKFEAACDFNRAVSKMEIGKNSTNIYYLYAGYKIKTLTPYVQYYHGIKDFVVDYTNAIAGVRYNLSALSVIKVEAQFLKADDFTKINQFKILWAVGF